MTHCSVVLEEQALQALSPRIQALATFPTVHYFDFPGATVREKQFLIYILTRLIPITTVLLVVRIVVKVIDIMGQFGGRGQQLLLLFLLHTVAQDS